jgi:hypothetical protein
LLPGARLARSPWQLESIGIEVIEARILVDSHDLAFAGGERAESRQPQGDQLSGALVGPIGDDEDRPRLAWDEDGELLVGVLASGGDQLPSGSTSTGGWPSPA